MHYICKSSNPEAINVVQCADEVVNLFLSGKKQESLKKSSEFMKKFNLYKFGNELVGIKAFSDVVKNATDVKWNEFKCALTRISLFEKGEKIDDFGYEHNVMTIDWLIYEIGLIDKNNKNDGLTNIRNKYFKEPVFFFSRDDEDKFTGNRSSSFFRSAYRAEIYSRQIFTMNLFNNGVRAKASYTLKTGEQKTVDTVGMYDMYTPLILSRIGVEQCLKAMFEEKYKCEALSKVSDCRTKLEKDGYISKAFSNELYAVIKRGNNNVHNSDAAYNFGIMHSIEILKKCAEYFKRK